MPTPRGLLRSRELPGLAPNILTERLRRLEREGLAFGADTGVVSPPRRVLGALGGRRSLVMVDQAVSSGSNFLVTANVAGPFAARGGR